jgi:lysine biosynthesis protein LysW
MATCPECDAEIEVDDDDLEELDIGDDWECDACGTRLRVANLDPLDFESEDDDDDEEDDEEEESEEEGEKEDDDVEIDEDDVDDDEEGEDWDE